MRMEIAVKLSKPEGEISVSVSIVVSECNEPIAFRNLAMRSESKLSGLSSSSATYAAVEAACLSGARHARRKLGLSGIRVELRSYSWSGKVANAEPFATAVVVACCKAFQKAELIGDELDGWIEERL